MIFEKILNAGHIGIFTHMSPDGDALGSTFALAGWLKQSNRKFTVFLPSPISESLSFMLPACMEKHIVLWKDSDSTDGLEKLSGCDLLIGLDFNNVSRIGGWEAAFRAAPAVKILVDHHMFPEENAFDTVISRTDISSASELLYSLLKQAPGINGDVSRLNAVTRESLLTGMTTDTNNFANSVYPSTLAMASELIAAGTDRDSIIQKLFFSYPERRIKAQGYILDKLLRLTPEGVAYIFLDSRTQTRLGLQEGDTEGFVNIALSMERIRMSILAKRERGTDKIRISIRSKKGTSARECAAEYFHGGGHELASGGKLVIGTDIASEKDVCGYIQNTARKFFMER
ncbi:MAG: DHH family phosphoesterase [Bacteroidales bacterium]|nr:DHH family phosphoesterase [Candidatus Hennigimonas equi]